MAVCEERQAFAGEDVDDGQRAKVVAVFEAVTHEVHAPALVRSRRDRRNNAQVTCPLLPLLGPDGQVFQAIQLIDAFVIHGPPFALEQHRQPPIAEAPSRLRQLSQPYPKGRLVFLP
jgi:hypothetical protein